MRKKAVNVGGVIIGGGAPVSIQSMTNTDTRNLSATLEQIHRLEKAGADIVRLSVFDAECVEVLQKIVRAAHVPLVADVHFDHRLAIGAIKAGVSKLRINPGNIGSKEKVRELVAVAKHFGTPIRIGVNGGSLEKKLLQEYGVCAQALQKSAERHIEMLESAGFFDIIVSLKASNVKMTVEANRLAYESFDYPLHLGVTEAGAGEDAVIKSAIGIGSLLVDGIGDTMRVSITGDAVQEIAAAKGILNALRIRRTAVEIISCPTCGRTVVNLVEIVERVKKELPKDGKPICVAVMGCAVNGPGEAREADIGIAFGTNNAVVFKSGEQCYSDIMPNVIERFIADASALMKE